MAEFTGERVIPGLVDADLLNEHRARYRFARWFLSDAQRPARVLDAACGAGYGAQELPPGTQVTALDIAADATALARSVTSAVVQASCEALPFTDCCFDLILAFEMIEHLQDAGAFLSGARRVLRQDGVLLVSTPNRAYYAESRGAAGPNPFHTYEYDYDEFSVLLQSVFPHVHIWTQNHAPAIVFAPARPGSQISTVDAVAGTENSTAHFFLAACALHPLSAGGTFAWIPDSGNVLRQREHHIARLEAEVKKKDQWLFELQHSLASLQSVHTATEAELRQRNYWGEALNRELIAAGETIGELEKQADERLAWVRQTEAELAAARVHIEKQDSLIAERTQWAQANEAEKNEMIGLYRDLEASTDARLREAAAALIETNERHALHLRLIAASRWVKLGRRLKIGPEIK